jgi:hypothetical protein
MPVIFLLEGYYGVPQDMLQKCSNDIIPTEPEIFHEFLNPLFDVITK